MVAVAVDAGWREDSGEPIQELQSREKQGAAAGQVGVGEEAEDLVDEPLRLLGRPGGGGWDESRTGWPGEPGGIPSPRDPSPRPPWDRPRGPGRGRYPSVPGRYDAAWWSRAAAGDRAGCGAGPGAGGRNGPAGPSHGAGSLDRHGGAGRSRGAVCCVSISRRGRRWGEGMEGRDRALGCAGKGPGTNATAREAISATRLKPVVYGCVTALLVGVAVVANLVPAHRASKTEPVQSLREG